MNISTGYDLSGPGSVDGLTTALPNGTYSWLAATSVAGWSAFPSSGTIRVEGGPVEVNLSIGPALGTVTFQAKGPTTDGHLSFPWYVNITGQAPHSGAALTYTANLSYGTYSYRIASSTKAYYPTKGSGTVTVTRTALVIYVTFAQRTYLVEFLFVLPKSPPRLTISLGVVSQTGAFQSWGVDEPNGTYNWSVTHLPLGYVVSPSHGTVHVEGPVASITLTVTEPGWGPFGLGVLGYGLVVGAPALAALWYAVYRSRRKRGRRGPVAPKARPAPKAPKPPRPRRGSRDLRPDEL